MGLNRKAFVTTLGVSGLALGMMVGAATATPPALAQDQDQDQDQAQDEETTQASEEGDERAAGPGEDGLELRQEFYGDFTAALADELSIASADEVDAAIRVAMMAVIDQREADGLLTYGQAEAIKTLIATSDVPFGPGMAGGHGPMMGGFREHSGEKGRFFISHGEHDGPAISRIRGARGGEEADSGPAGEEPSNDSRSNEDEESASS